MDLEISQCKRFSVGTECVIQFFNLDLGFNPESVLDNLQRLVQKIAMKTGNNTA